MVPKDGIGSDYDCKCVFLLTTMLMIIPPSQNCASAQH